MYRTNTAEVDNVINGAHQGRQPTEDSEMNTQQALHPGHKLSSRAVLLALAGAVLAVVTGYGVATVVLDESSAGDAPAPAGTYIQDGHDRDIRGLMHQN